MAPEPPDGLEDDSKAETVHVFYRRTEANLAAANLQAHGIRCWISADDAGGMYPNLAGPEGVSLLVNASDAAAARALLNPVSASELPDENAIEAGGSSPTTTAPRTRWSPGQIIVGLVAGVLLCLFWQWGSQLGTKVHYHYYVKGIADEEWVYHNGILVEFMRDRNHDGKWDEWAHYENGRLKQTQLDNNFDGKPDETWNYSYGNLVGMEKDTDFNGTPDEFMTYEHHVLRQIDIRPNGASFATQRKMYQDGVLAEILLKPDRNGHFTESVKYDPFENPISTNWLQ